MAAAHAGQLRLPAPTIMKHVTLRLCYDPPFDWPAALTFLARRAIDGVEQVEGAIYRRTIRCDGSTGVIEVRHDERNATLLVEVHASSLLHTSAVSERLRRMFDLDANLGTITAHLSRDASMASLVAARPALRVPGGWDGFEVAVRSVMGQQVSVEHARRLNGTLVERCDSSLPNGVGTLRRLFPTPKEVLDTDLSALGMPRARVTTLQTVANAVMAGPQLFDRASCLDDTIQRLRAIRGIGDWTAQYIAMRACREPDAFPASDVGLLRGATGGSGRRPTPTELLARAEGWRPWRAYAAHHLWAIDRGSCDTERGA